MSAWDRILLVAGLALAMALLVHLSKYPMAWAWRTFKISDPDAVYFFTRTAMTAICCLPLLIFPRLRDVGSMEFPWTWTTLLFLPALALVWSFTGLPSRVLEFGWLAALGTVWYQFMVALAEEVVFRGYAFCRIPQEHPRLVVLATAAGFASSHLVNIAAFPLKAVLWSLPHLFAMGLSFGIVRMVSGSLAWCIVIHTALNAARPLNSQFLNQMTPYKTALTLAAAVAVLCLHPIFRSSSPADDGSQNGAS